MVEMAAGEFLRENTVTDFSRSVAYIISYIVPTFS